jgi:hypothetical protein
MPVKWVGVEIKAGTSDWGLMKKETPGEGEVLAAPAGFIKGWIYTASVS